MAPLSILKLATPLAAVGCALVAAFTDVQSRRIPNWLTLPAMLVGLALHLVSGGWKGLGSSLSALLFCGAVFLVFHLAGGMGAGDVKLIAALGGLLGLPSAGLLLVCTALCGGVLALALAFSRGRLRETMSNVLVLSRHHSTHGLAPHPQLNVRQDGMLRLPYALAIAGGAILTVYLQPSFRVSL